MKGLREILTAKHIKPTHQRLKILKYLQASRCHPTPEKIYHDLVKDMPTMSKTTVYNTLKALADKNIILPVSLAGTEVRYELSGSRHHHFVCEKCRRIIDLDVMCPNMQKGEIDGHVINELHGYFKGICAECAGKAKGRE